MNPLPGELYLVDLGMIGKVRPAVVVSRELKRRSLACGRDAPRMAYSARNATMGSTFVARRAGMRQAASATSASATGATSSAA